MLLSGLDNAIRRLLDAEIHHLVPVIAQDDVDQILADVVHITFEAVAKTIVPFCEYKDFRTFDFEEFILGN